MTTGNASTSPSGEGTTNLQGTTAPQGANQGGQSNQGGATIENPEAFLKAFNSVKEELKILREEKEVWSQSAGKNGTVDPAEYLRLQQTVKTFEQERESREQKALQDQGKWEELTERRVRTVSDQWEQKYNALAKEKQDLLVSSNQSKSEIESLQKQLGAANHRRLGFETFIQNGGIPEQFAFVWGGALESGTFVGEDGSLKVAGAEPGKPKTKEDGSELTIDEYLSGFKSTPTGGGFFAPNYRAAGSGATNGNNQSSVGTGGVIKITKAQAGDAGFMRKLNTQVKQQFGKDVDALDAINKGLVVVSG